MDPSEVLASAQAALRSRAERGDAEAAALRRRAAEAVDECIRRGVQLRGDQVDKLLLRPPWTPELQRPPAAADGLGWSVARSRAELCARRPAAAGLLGWMDMRGEALEPYRRLSYARWTPWAVAAVDATVAAVQRARAALLARPGAAATSSKQSRSAPTWSCPADPRYMDRPSPEKPGPIVRWTYSSRRWTASWRKSV